MKFLFSIILSILIILSFVAWYLKPDDANADKRLVWVADENYIRVEQVELFNQLNPENELTLDSASQGPDAGKGDKSGGVEKIAIQCLAGLGPDVLDVYGRWQLQTYVDAGMILDITEEANKRGFGLENTWPQIRSSLSIDGRQYGYPGNVTGTVLFYNKAVFEKLGVNYPPNGEWKWEDLVDLSQKLTIKNNEGERTFGVIGVDYYNLLIQNDASIFDEDGLKCVFDSERAVEAIQFYYDLMFKYNVMPTPAQLEAMSCEGGWAGGKFKWFASGKVGMIYGGRWMMVLFRRYPELRVGATHLPFKRVDTCKVNTRFSAINKNSKNVAGAYKFLGFLSGPDFSKHLLKVADSMPGNPIYTEDDSFLHDDEFPEEDFNHIFPEAIRKGKSLETCKLMNPFIASRIISRHLDLMTSGVKTPSEMCRDATDEINQKIKKNLNDIPKYRKIYEEVTGQKWHSEMNL